MRRRLPLLCALAMVAAGPPVRADGGLREKVARYFEGWFGYYPGASVGVADLPEIGLPGLEGFRADRRSSSSSHQESSPVLADPVRGEIFIGDAYGDPSRRAARRPFDQRTDLPNIQASLAESFGLPVRVSLGGASRGPLKAIRVAIRQRPDAILELPGFVSEDGSVVAIGEFHSLSEPPQAFRRRLLSERPGVRVGSGRFTVAEFLDFQCERCRARAPAVEKAVAKSGGAIEAHFLPLTKNHDWAFAAAEAAAALASLDSSLYGRYRDAVFAHAQNLSEKGCRDLASDVAEAAGVTQRFQAEISSGRARDRVLADILLATRLGISGTPSFVLEGAYVSGEDGLFESYLFERMPRPAGGGR